MHAEKSLNLSTLEYDYIDSTHSAHHTQRKLGAADKRDSIRKSRPLVPGTAKNRSYTI